MRPAKRARLTRIILAKKTRNRRVDPVQKLLPELIERIFSHLPLKDLCSCSAVSRAWYNAVNNNSLWKALCVGKGWNDCGKFRDNVDCFENFDRDIDRINNFIEWKKHFILKNQIKKNWFKGNYQKCKIPLTVEEIASITCVTSSNMLLAYGCNNGELKVFDIKDEYTLIQTIQCIENSSIQTIKISPKYLVFCQNFVLFIFKANEKGTYDFCSIKVMETKTVVEIRDPSSYIGEDLEKTFSEYVSDSEYAFFQKDALFGVKFEVVEDRLIAATNISQTIYIWNLRSSKIKMCHSFELDDNAEVGDICVSNNVLYLSVIVKKQEASKPSSPFDWYLQAFSLKSYKQLYRSDILRYDEVTIPALEANNSYVTVSFRTGHIYIFDRLNGKLLFEDCSLVFLDALPENSDFVGLKHNECLVIYNPKTKRTIVSVDLQGSPWGIYHDVLITVCTGFDRFGRGIPYMEFWWLKKKKYLSYGPILVLTFRSLSNLVFIDETKIVLFVENKFLYIFSFMA